MLRGAGACRLRPRTGTHDAVCTNMYVILFCTTKKVHNVLNVYKKQAPKSFFISYVSTAIIRSTTFFKTYVCYVCGCLDGAVGSGPYFKAMVVLKVPGVIPG